MLQNVKVKKNKNSGFVFYFFSMDPRVTHSDTKNAATQYLFFLGILSRNILIVISWKSCHRLEVKKTKNKKNLLKHFDCFWMFLGKQM